MNDTGGGPASVPFVIADAVALLRRTPPALRALLTDLPPVWARGTEGPGTWSPYDVVGHLIHGERTDYIPRARIILAQGTDRRFTPFDREAQFRESGDRPLEALLDEFAELRAANIATLESWHLTEAQLALTGEHPEFGTVTLAQLLATWAAHDLTHLAQIARAMAKQYRETVGPWRKYLSIMDR